MLSASLPHYSRAITWQMTSRSPSDLTRSSGTSRVLMDHHGNKIDILKMTAATRLKKCISRSWALAILKTLSWVTELILKSKITPSNHKHFNKLQNTFKTYRTPFQESKTPRKYLTKHFHKQIFMRPLHKLQNYSIDIKHACPFKTKHLSKVPQKRNTNMFWSMVVFQNVEAFVRSLSRFGFRLTLSLTHMSDKHLFSPYNITANWNIQVTRIKEMITN